MTTRGRQATPVLSPQSVTRHRELAATNTSAEVVCDFLVDFGEGAKRSRL